MPWPLDEWYDWLRLVVLVFSVVCLFVLGRRYIRDRHGWKSTQREIWYVAVMWLSASAEMQIEGLLRDSPFRGRLFFVAAAVLVTAKIIFDSRSSQQRKKVGQP